ncbi:hypothetical protein ACHAXA_010245 [Cyclostephanos tholiformis]|uniref:Secreted protein n=1 Tax=Cyclostephanos tholiformis TaxID=382380 RepID=A0ABD3SG79_9STRA
MVLGIHGWYLGVLYVIHLALSKGREIFIQVTPNCINSWPKYNVECLRYSRNQFCLPSHSPCGSVCSRLVSVQEMELQ